MIKTTIVLLLLATLPLNAQSILHGKLIDSENSNPILFGTVALIQNGQIIKGVETDLDGNYYFKDIIPGVYDIEGSYVGYTPSGINNITISRNQTKERNLALTEGVLASECVMFNCPIPMVRFDVMESGKVITSEDIRHMPICK